MTGKVIIRIAVAMLLASSVPSTSFAQSKDVIRLKTQLDLLQQEATRLQSTLEEHLDTMKQLQESNAANALKLQQSLDAMRAELGVQQSKFNGRTDQASANVNTMNAGLQDLRTRLAAVSERTFPALPANAAKAGSSAVPPQAAPAPAIPSSPASASPAATAPAPASPPGATPPVASTPAELAQLYRSAVEHYSAQQFDLATSEFDKYLKLAPNSDSAPSAYFYLAECEYEQEDYEGALQDYTAAIPGLGNSPKAPTAAYKRGLTLLELQQDNDAISQLQFVVARFPQSSEARKATQKLKELGVVMSPGH